jgi:hypothetical protein
VLLANPKAVLLHANPDIFAVPDLLDAAQCDELLALYASRRATAPTDPSWCFAPHMFNLQTEHPELNSRRNSEGDDCITDQVQGAKIAAQHQRSVSRSIMIAKAEVAAVDLVGRFTEEQAGLDENHAFHTQVRSAG